jgi:hypothetical protein
VLTGLYIHSVQEQIFKMVLRGHIDFKTDPWPKLSESAKDLVRRLLEQDPTKRATSQVGEPRSAARTAVHVCRPAVGTKTGS